MESHHHYDNTSPISFLTKGSQVEVSSDEDGFTGAWFVATVIQPPLSISTPIPKNDHTRNNLVYVEYHNLLSEDGSSTRLREYANISYVRPSPRPATNANPPNFQLNDLVDAFYRDGWWTGTITAVVDTSNFVVTFQNPPDRLNFHFSDLRPHRKWVDGRWVQPENQSTAGLMFTVGKKVEVSFDSENLRDAWFPATILKNISNNSFLVEYQQPGIGDEAALHKVTVDYLHIRPSPPHLRDKNFVLLEKVDAYYDFGWWSGVITKELADNRYNVFFKHTKKEREFIHSRIRPHMEWKGGKWFNASQGDMDGKTTRSLIDEQTIPGVDEQSTVATSIMKRTKQTNLSAMAPCKNTNDPPVSVGQSEVVDSEARSFGKTENLSHGKKVRSKRGIGNELKSLTMDSSRKKGKLANELRNLKALGEGTKDDSVKARTQENFEVEDAKELQSDGMTTPHGKKLQQSFSDRIASDPLTAEGDGENSAPKRKRGRPPKSQAKTPSTATAANHQNGVIAPSVVEENEVRPITSEQPGLEGKDNLPSSEDKHGRKKYLSMKGRRGRRRTISINTESPAQDSQDAFKEKPDGHLEETRNPEASGGKSVDTTMSDEQPLSKWFVDGTDEAANASENLPVTVDGTGKAPNDAENLAFVRSTPLWQTIESMEVFRKMPQKPHFRPLLEGVKESLREGLAIGCMVTFSSIVEKTCALRNEDPRSTIEDYLETLVELEGHGFDVEVMRDRLTRLLLIKDKQEELEQESHVVAEKMKEHKIDEKQMEQVIDKIDREMKELEERRRQVLLNKERSDSKMGAAKAAREGIQQQMTQIGMEFDGLAGAPLC